MLACCSRPPSWVASPSWACVTLSARHRVAESGRGLAAESYHVTTRGFLDAAASTAAPHAAVHPHHACLSLRAPRLYKLSRQRDPPLASAAVSDEPLSATTGSGVLSAVAIEGEGARPQEHHSAGLR